MTRSPARILKRVSLCSSLAIATSLVLGPSQASAQSFEANITPPVTTNGAVVSTSPGITDIALNGGQTIIDWTPNDNGPGPSGINFQPGGTATFHSDNNFAVLNRIVPNDPTRIIAMDGNILSTVGGQTGGSVFFYSPAGVVLGPNAFIDVGSLVLTTSPVEVTGGQFMDGTEVVFGQANPNSFVFTNPGSEIYALTAGSYVALVAPRVVHNGTINVNGSAALVAAEAATISFATDGLFNITVDVGTAESQNEGIEVNGTITGPASSGAGDNHRAYLVAVPKNTLLTMAIGSGANLGFDIAGAANVVGNAIILSAGHDIVGGNTSDAPSAAAGALANINLTNNAFTSALYGRASGDAIVGANNGGSATFASDVSLRAGGLVRFFSEHPESSVTVDGNLTLSANADGLNEGDAATAGTVQLMASGGGSLSVAGSTQLTAIGRGGFSNTTGVVSGDGGAGRSSSNPPPVAKCCSATGLTTPSVPTPAVMAVPFFRTADLSTAATASAARSIFSPQAGRPWSSRGRRASAPMALPASPMIVSSAVGSAELAMPATSMSRPTRDQRTAWRSATGWVSTPMV